MVSIVVYFFVLSGKDTIFLNFPSDFYVDPIIYCSENLTFAGGNTKDNQSMGLEKFLKNSAGWRIDDVSFCDAW